MQKDCCSDNFRLGDPQEDDLVLESSPADDRGVQIAAGAPALHPPGRHGLRRMQEDMKIHERKRDHARRSSHQQLGDHTDGRGKEAVY